MKKLAYLGALVLGLGMVACSDYKEPNPEIPSTPGSTTQVTAEGVSVTPSEAVAQADGTLNTIDLEGYVRMDMPIPAADITTDENFNPAYTNFRVVAQMATTEAFDRVAELDGTTYSAGKISLDPNAVEDAYLELIGRNPESRTVYTRYAIFAQGDGNSNIRLGGDDFFYGPVAMSVLPVDLTEGKLVEQKYYLVGTINNWDLTPAALIALDHSDRDAYDDGNFYKIIDIASGQTPWEWMVVPASAVDEAAGTVDLNAAYGPAEGLADQLSGEIVNINAAIGEVNVAGTYSFTINVLEDTYEFKFTPPYLYTPGGANGWSQTASMLIPTTNYETYEGYILIDGEFKVCAAPNWDDATTYGTAGDGILGLGGNGANIKATEGAGLYWFVCNINALTYKEPVKIQNIGLIGGFNSWGAQENLTPDAKELVWTGTVTFAEDTEWKFRSNDNWDINLGGDLDNLQYNGDNISTPAGTYNVTLDLSSLPYKATVTAK